MEMQDPSSKKKIPNLIEILKENWERADVSSRAAELAYFVLFSLFPILIVVANVIPLLVIDVDEVLEYIQMAVPPNIYDILSPILVDFVGSSSGGVISIGLITAVWSASKAFNSLQDVINEVYGTEKRKNFILVRVASFLTQLAIVSVVGVLVFAVVFGEQILRFIQNTFAVDLSVILDLFSLSWLLMLIVLFLVFSLIYLLVPNHHVHIKYGIPGAVFASIGFIVLSQGFSLYVRFAGGDASANGTIGVVIVLMLWLYLTAMIVLLGAFVNVVYFEFKTGQSIYAFEKEKEAEEKAEDIDHPIYPYERIDRQRRKLIKVKSYEERKES